MLSCGGREAVVVAPLPTRDSAASPRFHGCLDFFHRHFPPQPSPSHTLDPSFQSQQPPSPWVGLTIPKLQLPATVPSGVCIFAARTVWFLFHLGCHRSALSLSALNVSLLTQTNALMWGLDPCFSFPPPRAGPVLLTPQFPPQFLHPTEFCMGLYIVSAAQVLLCALNCCSGCTSVSEGVFLMYPWREKYSASTYSSAILFLPPLTLK